MASKIFKVKNGVTYRYHVTAEGYTTPTGVQNPGYVTIDGQPQPITIELVPATNFYSFTIYTDTANTVVINDEQIYDTGHTGQFTKSNIAEGTQIIYTVSREYYNSETNADNPIILNQDTDINITLTPAVKRLTVNVNGYDNVQGTTTDITQSCTFTFTVDGQTTTTSDNYIDVQADTTVKFNVECNGYTEKLYSEGGTLPLDHYVTVGNSSRTETVNMEKSTNQYTVTWNVVDGAGNPITGYEINVTVNEGTTHSIPGNTYTGTINDKIVWSCGIDQQHTTDGGVINHLTSDQTLTATLRGQTYTAEVTVYNGPQTQNIRVADARVRFINTSTQQYEEVLTNSNGSATYGVEYGVIYNVAVSKDPEFWNEPTQDEIAIYPTYPYRVYKNDTTTQLSVGVSIYPSTTYWEFSVVPTPNTPVTVTMNNTQVSVIRPTTDGDSYGGMFPPRTLVNYEITTTLSGYQSLSGSEYISTEDDFKNMPKTLPAAQTGTATFTAQDDDTGDSITGFTLYVDGVQQSGNTYTDVIGSSHTYRLVKSGYQDATGGFTISSTSVYVPCIMRVDVSANYLVMELTDSSDELYWSLYHDGGYYTHGATIYYSVDDGQTWVKCTVSKSGGQSPVTAQTKINATVGQRVIFKYFGTTAANTYANSSWYCHFTNKNYSTSQVYVYGNMASLLSSTSVDIGEYGFRKFFSGLNIGTKYVNGSPKILDMSDINLNRYCYHYTFENQHNMIVPPRLFKPNQQKTLYERCFYYMFYNCDAMTSMPDLPVTSLANYCYSNMFNKCTSLTETSVIPNTNYPTGCFEWMFRYCSSLNKVTWLMTAGGGDSSSFNGTFSGVAASGTLYKNPSSASQALLNSIPSGWTITNYTGS